MNDKEGRGDGARRKRQAIATTAAVRRNVEKLALVAKALSHPARVEIVLLLHARQTCVGCDIVDEVGLAQSTTSEHLRLLKAAEVIVGEIERPRVCYSLNPEALEPLHALLGELRDGRGGARGMAVNAPVHRAPAPALTPPVRASTPTSNTARRGSSSKGV
jgi:ArsR family transcriptional regulator